MRRLVVGGGDAVLGDEDRDVADDLARCGARRARAASGQYSQPVSVRVVLGVVADRAVGADHVAGVGLHADEVVAARCLAGTTSSRGSR